MTLRSEVGRRRGRLGQPRHSAQDVGGSPKALVSHASRKEAGIARGSTRAAAGLQDSGSGSPASRAGEDVGGASVFQREQRGSSWSVPGTESRVTWEASQPVNSARPDTRQPTKDVKARKVSNVTTSHTKERSLGGRRLIQEPAHCRAESQAQPREPEWNPVPWEPTCKRYFRVTWERSQI